VPLQHRELIVRELPFDADHEPEEPPPGVAHLMLWRIAVRVHRDHSREVRDSAGSIVCALCRQPWPCFGRRMAQRALRAAWHASPPSQESLGLLDRPAKSQSERPRGN